MDISKLIPPNKTEDEAYKAGFDNGLNGASMDNCHFAFFATPEKTKSWEQGSKDGASNRP